MKSVSVIFFVSFVFATNLQNIESKKMNLQEIRENLQPLKQICIDKVKVDPKLVDEASKGNFVPDRKLQCYYKCMLLNTKVMTKDDKILERAFTQNVKLLLRDEYLEPIMKALIHCRPISLKPLEGCELAYELSKCYYEFNPEYAVYP